MSILGYALERACACGDEGLAEAASPALNGTTILRRDVKESDDDIGTPETGRI